ncbi:hypothetical protein X734_24445 [Mesorhizobium sp. L2C084A000]|nr:hypothetical protein X734_24445 [Mesorhizobium sp. L2C084A000]
MSIMPALTNGKGGEVGANLCIIGCLEHHAAARDVASVPHLAYRAFGIERAPLFGFAG